MGGFAPHANNEASGLLADSLQGFVNWVLECPQTNMYLLDNATETNKLVNPYIFNEINPLVHWIKSNLVVSPGDSVKIGKKTNKADTHLFPNYLRFCNEYGYKPLGFNIFSTLLIQQLHSQCSKNIYKTRTMSGTSIVGIKIEYLSDETIFPTKNISLDIQQEFEIIESDKGDHNK